MTEKEIRLVRENLPKLCKKYNVAFMRKRKNPAVLRIHKFKEETNPKEF